MVLLRFLFYLYLFKHEHEFLTTNETIQNRLNYFISVGLKILIVHFTTNVIYYIIYLHFNARTL